MCGITRIYTDNIDHILFVNETTIDIRLPKLCIWDKYSTKYDLERILEVAVPEILDNFRYPPAIFEEEVRTVVIEAGGYKYCRVIDPCDHIILENCDKPGTDKPVETFENYRTFREISERVITLESFVLPPDLNPKSHEMISKVLLAAFPECDAITDSGDALLRNHVIKRECMGSGYNQILKTMVLVWMVMHYDVTVYLNNWYNHLHPVLKNWFWNNVLGEIKESNIKGTLIIDKSE